MRRIATSPASEGETEFQICEHNIRFSDKNHNLKYFIISSMAWFKLNPDKSYQDFETYLRENKFQTYLIAKKHKKLPEGTMLKKINQIPETPEPEFECIYSCRPAPHALNELLSISESYKVNFANLLKAGVLSASSSDIIKEKFTDEEQTLVFTLPEKKLNDDIISNKVKIFYEDISAEEFIRILKKDCFDNFGKEPVEKMIRMGRNGEPIMGFFVDDKLVYKWGIMVSAHNNGPSVKIINL